MAVVYCNLERGNDYVSNFTRATLLTLKLAPPLFKCRNLKLENQISARSTY